MGESMKEDEKSFVDTEVDILEHSPLRVLGYFGRIGRILGTVAAKGSRYVAFSSDVGEAFRPVVDQKYVKIGYGVAIAYVITDVGLTGYQAHKKGSDVTRATLQQATFQLFGSLLIPSLVIHQGVHLAQKGFLKVKVPKVQRWGPVIAGLAMIPFMPVLIDEPVEHAVHWGFNRFWPEKTKHE